MSHDMVEQARDGFARAAAGWERWSHLIDQRDDGPSYVDAAGVCEGQRVLEIGAGTGNQTLLLARTVGDDGHVVATDLTEQMLAIARRRADAEGLDNITFLVADVGELELDGATFDAAVSGLTWMFLPDPVGAAARVRSLLEPGGRFAASVWGPAEEVPMVSAAVDAAMRHMQLDRPPAPERTAPDLSDAAVFGDVLAEAGFVDVTVEALTFSMTWDSPATYAAWVRDMFADLAGLIGQHAAGRADAVYAAIADAVQADARADGRLTYDNTALMGAGRRPGPS